MATVRSMEVGQTFASWEEFSTFFKAWKSENNVSYCVDISRTVQQANKLLKKKPYHAKFKYSYIRFVCKHYGQHKSKSSGVRPNQR